MDFVSGADGIVSGRNGTFYLLATENVSYYLSDVYLGDVVIYSRNQHKDYPLGAAQTLLTFAETTWGLFAQKLAKVVRNA